MHACMAVCMSVHKYDMCVDVYVCVYVCAYVANEEFEQFWQQGCMRDRLCVHTSIMGICDLARVHLSVDTHLHACVLSVCLMVSPVYNNVC